MELQSEWRYTQIINIDPTSKNWADNLKTICNVKTAPELLTTLDEIKRVGLENLTDVNFFKSTINPMWEDPININGGRCILEIPTSQKEKLFEIWKITVAMCASGAFDNICGCVFSEKANFRIAIWISDPREAEDILKAWKEVVDCSQAVFSFSLHNRFGDFSKSKRKSFSRK